MDDIIVEGVWFHHIIDIIFKNENHKIIDAKAQLRGDKCGI